MLRGVQNLSRCIHMKLKKLETVGFKSFAERISVDFVPGVTAVVESKW